MTLGEDPLFADIDDGDLVAVDEHSFEVLRRNGLRHARAPLFGRPDNSTGRINIWRRGVSMCLAPGRLYLFGAGAATVYD